MMPLNLEWNSIVRVIVEGGDPSAQTLENLMLLTSRWDLNIPPRLYVSMQLFDFFISKEEEGSFPVR
jgi:hypothetical protein